MGIEKLIPVAVAFAMMAAASRQLPRLVREIQIAQLRLLKESQPSTWGKRAIEPLLSIGVTIV